MNLTVAVIFEVINTSLRKLTAQWYLTSGGGTHKRTYIQWDITALVIETYGSKVRIFENSIPMSVRAAETSAEGVSIYQHDPKGRVAGAYQSLTEEVLGNYKQTDQNHTDMSYTNPINQSTGKADAIDVILYNKNMNSPIMLLFP